MKPVRLFLFILCISVAGRVFAGAPTPTDYIVWSAVVDDPTGSVYIWHMTEPSSIYDCGEVLGRQTDPEATRLAANASEQAPVELQADRFQTRAKIYLLDRKMLKRIVGRRPKPTWLLSPRAIDGAAGVYRLSSPAYSEDGNTAYVLCCYCSAYHGSVELVTVVKNPAGDWYAQRFVRKDFVHWTAGSYLSEQD